MLCWRITIVWKMNNCPRNKVSRPTMKFWGQFEAVAFVIRKKGNPVILSYYVTILYDLPGGGRGEGLPCGEYGNAMVVRVGTAPIPSLFLFNLSPSWEFFSPSLVSMPDHSRLRSEWKRQWMQWYLAMLSVRTNTEKYSNSNKISTHRLPRERTIWFCFFSLLLT